MVDQNHGRDPPRPMTAAEFAAIGEYIYGDGEWQLPLCRALGKSFRAVQRWRSGKQAIPDTIAARMRTLRQIAAIGQKEAAATAAADANRGQ